MPTLDTDLSTRWTPTPAQDRAAAHVLIDTALDYVYTAHMLVNKNYGWWTTDVKVVPLTPNVFASRDEVLRFLEGAAEATRVANSSLLFTMGYTRHHLTGPDEDTPTAAGRSWLTAWAVFEDILATSSGDGDN